MSEATPSAPQPDPNDPLALAELFTGGGEPWLPVLKPVIEARADADRFIGPGRSPQVVPVRELTFQALKPHPAHKWKVVVCGQT
ncbi:uracil-DNA glycosylase, partial [Streptomyces hydrogenans]